MEKSLKYSVWICSLLAFSYFFMSCSEALKPVPLTYTKVFTGDDHKSWSIQYLQFKQEGKGDQTFGLDACQADDKYIFYANPDREYAIDNNSTTCTSDIGVSNSITDTWSFVNATATLTIIIPVFSDSALPFFVRSATDKQLVLEIFTDQSNTSSYRIYFNANQN